MVRENKETDSQSVQVLCILSRYPWFTVFGSILQKIELQWEHNIEHSIENDGNKLVEGILRSIFDSAQASFPAPGKIMRIASWPAGAVESGSVLELCRPDDARDPVIDVSHSQLFSLLSVPCIMAVFSALLSEQRVIMVSDNVERLSACMHSATALLYPFSWSQIYVPLLPSTLIDYLTAPMPFFVGIHESMMQQVMQLPTEDELVFINLDRNEVQLYVDGLAQIPSLHAASLEKRIRKLVVTRQNEIATTDQEPNQAAEIEKNFDSGISEAFIDFMVSIFGNYRNFIDTEFEFNVEDFTAATERSESTQAFLQKFRGSQMFELWARERAALVSRASAAAEVDGSVEEFSLATYDKFEAVVEIEGNYVGMNFVAKAMAKAAAKERGEVVAEASDQDANEQTDTHMQTKTPGLVAAYHKELALALQKQAAADADSKQGGAGTRAVDEAAMAIYKEILDAGSIDQDTYDSLVQRLEQYTTMKNDAVISQEEYNAIIVGLEAEIAEALNDLRGRQAMATAIELFNAKGYKKGLIHLEENWQAIGLNGPYPEGPTPENMAKFLKAKAVKGGLKKSEIGELLGGGKPVNVEIRVAYTGLFDFSSMSFVKCLRTFLVGFKLPGESMLIERIMADFAARYYACNPAFAQHLTAEKVAELKAAFEACDSLVDGRCPALDLCRLVKSVPGDYKYMKDDDIINDMIHINISEVNYIAENVLQIQSPGDAELQSSIPLIEVSCSAAAALAVAEKAATRADEYQNDVVKMEAQLAEMADGDEKTKYKSRLENSRKQAHEKAGIAVTVREDAEQKQHAAQEAADVAFVSWPLFVTMMAHKMGNDTAFVLAYSTIQLNTDAHNPKLDDAGRMTKQMFLANNRRSPDLAILPDSFVGQLYDEIVNAEIKILDENDVAAMSGMSRHGRHCHSTLQLTVIACQSSGIYIRILRCLLSFSVKMTVSPPG